jgi:hypothetical protein
MTFPPLAIQFAQAENLPVIIVDLASMFYSHFKKTPQRFWEDVQTFVLQHMAQFEIRYILDGPWTLAKHDEHIIRQQMRAHASNALEQVVVLADQRGRVSKSLWKKAGKLNRQCSQITLEKTMENFQKIF